MKLLFVVVLIDVVIILIWIYSDHVSIVSRFEQQGLSVRMFGLGSLVYSINYLEG